MKKLLYLAFIITFTFAFGGCAKESAEEVAANTLPPEKPAAEVQKAPAPKMAPAPASAPAPARPSARPSAPAPAATPAPAPRKPSIPATVQVPEGTELNVLLIDSISTGKNKAGDQFMASLADPIVVDGQRIVARGTKVQGRVVDAEGSGRVKGKATIHLVLTSILDGGKAYPIVTKPFVAEAESTKGRDAGMIGGAAGIGAAIGAIAGGKGGAAKGAIIGGAAGTGTVLATKGKEVEFDSETKLKFTLDKDAEFPRIMGKIS
jgi:hypothetical protein